MITTWNSASDHDNQGSSAINQWGYSNEVLVDLAKQANVRVMTLGNLNDCVFAPNQCGIDIGFLNKSTQVANNANVSSLLLFGGNCQKIALV